MNGISSNLKDEIKKSTDLKNKEKLKFIAAILITNIMVALLCVPSKEDKVIAKSIEKPFHKDYQIVIIPLTALVDEEAKKAPETLISLMSKDKKMIVSKAYLHEEMEKVEGISQFKIEIANSDLTKISDILQEGVVAIPFVEMKKTVSVKKRGSKYEINL